MAHPGRPRKCDPKVEWLSNDIRQKRNPLVKSVLDEVGIDCPDGNARTALIHAAAYNNLELLKWLIEKGANVNHQDRIGYCALHFAGQNKLVDIAKFLLENGADPNLQDIHGNSPLWTAVFESKAEKEVMNLILKSGGDPNLYNKYDKSPGDLYKMLHNIEIPKF